MKAPETREERLEREKERAERACQNYNSQPGNMNLNDGIDCPLCMNRGQFEKLVYFPERDYYDTEIVHCECKKQRDSWRLIQASGLAGALREMTFDTFAAKEPWQRCMKSRALDYVQGRGGLWFFIGGQVGCGKSHICTAICGEFLRKNQKVRYMKWAEESVRLKNRVTEDNYTDLLKDYKECDVLYIDDFHKSQRTSYGTDMRPSSADLRLAFEIIDYRYCEKKKTVISSEWMIDELMDFDDATASRIYEMCRDSIVQIGRDANRNYRHTEMVKGLCAERKKTGDFMELEVI